MVNKVTHPSLGISILKLYFIFSTCLIDAEAVMVAKGLHYFNSVLNPIIYSLMNQQFKTAFNHLFHLTRANLSGKGPKINRADIDRKLSFTGFSSLKSRSSLQGRISSTANDVGNQPEKV